MTFHKFADLYSKQLGNHLRNKNIPGNLVFKKLEKSWNFVSPEK